MPIREQADRLYELGIDRLIRTSRAELVAHVDKLPEISGTTLTVHPSLVSAAELATLMERAGKPGFVVEDMTDLADFRPIDDVTVPDQPLYLLHDIDRGDDMRNWRPDEALPAIIEKGRTPLTINEGISWVLQQPDTLEPNFCFMTIGSRKSTNGRVDARTPAIWISGGTGRDGAERKGAPKVGWCWAGNKHTWLGFASASRRSG